MLVCVSEVLVCVSGVLVWVSGGHRGVDGVGVGQRCGVVCGTRGMGRGYRTLLMQGRGQVCYVGSVCS